MTDIGRLEQTEISQEAKKAYLDYAMSVIVARALPDVRDGLKPVHRRILYAMHEMGLTPNAKFAKSAKIVGETMGKYHPHGDMPIYDALVRLAQDFSMRYPLVQGQGNFGSMDGDPPAAMRYTEAKLAPIAMELLHDIEKDTVPFLPNFDATLKEPVFLPAKLPNLLLMGSEGIAVGMATKIPPHNLAEVVDAIIFAADKAKIEKYKTDKEKEEFQITSEATVEELLEFIKGPDFPTGGAIYDINEIKNVYKTGRGSIVVRGIAEIEDIGGGKSAIIIHELPYQVNKAALVAKIAQLAKDKKIEGITDLRDESDRRGIRIVVELKRDAVARKVLNNIYKYTPLQTTFPANFVALVDGIPLTLSLKQIIEEYIKHRFSVVTRRSEFELKEAKARLHILDGLLLALENIDAVIETIKKSKTGDEARTNLMNRFSLSEIQANAILDMQLRRLAALEREKIEDEWRMVKETIDYLEALLADPKKILGVIKDELLKIKEKYQDERRTRVFKSKVDEFSEEDLIANEPTVITITKTGYIKRQATGSFRVQQRGGKGVRGMTTKDEDEISHLVFGQTHDYILFFTNFGKVYQTRVFEIQESSRTSRGQAIVNLIDIGQEKIESVLLYNPKDAKENNFILMATQKGIVKKTRLLEFKNIRRSGIIAIKLDEDDRLSWAAITDGESDVLLVTKLGKIICFPEKQIRESGRSTIGVRGIKIDKDDEVISMDVLEKDGKEKYILVIAENGVGKKVSLEELRHQNRAGKGIKIANLSARTGNIVYTSVVEEDHNEVLITSRLGQVVRIPISAIPARSRNAQGVILMRFNNPTDKVASATTISK